MTSETSSSHASPQMDNCCWKVYVSQLELAPTTRQHHSHTATSMRSRATSSMLRMTFFSILTSCDSLRERSGPKAPAAFLRKAWPTRKRCQRPFQSSSISIGGRARCRVGPSRVAGGGDGRPIRQRRKAAATNGDRARQRKPPQPKLLGSHSPIPPFPSHRLDLVEDNGGGGFSICEAVGARVWRME